MMAPATDKFRNPSTKAPASPLPRRRMKNSTQALGCRMCDRPMTPDRMTARTSTDLSTHTSSGSSLFPRRVLPTKACPNMLRSRVKCLARRLLEVAQVLPHDWYERLLLFRECGEAIERPRAHERLRKRDVFEKDLLDAIGLCRTPVKQRQGPNDLQPDFPLVARCERADEDFLVGRDPLRMFAGQFLQEIERALRDQPILVGGERGQLDHERRVVFD